MRTLIGVAVVVLSLSGCEGYRGPERPIMKFYQQAKQRQKEFDRNRPIALDGLKFDFGVLPGSSGAGTFEQSSLVVTDPDSRETQAVQVIVEPRVSGSFLDPAEPSTEFLRQQALDIEKALKTRRYVAVFILPKPIDEQAVAPTHSEEPSLNPALPGHGSGD